MHSFFRELEATTHKWLPVNSTKPTRSESRLKIKLSKVRLRIWPETMRMYPLYNPIKNTIMMPNVLCYPTDEHFLVVLFHEIMHAVSDPSLKEDEEEVYAEIGAILLARKFKIKSGLYYKNCLAYIKEYSSFLSNTQMEKIYDIAQKKQKKALERIKILTR